MKNPRSPRRSRSRQEQGEELSSIASVRPVPSAHVLWYSGNRATTRPRGQTAPPAMGEEGEAYRRQRCHQHQISHLRLE
jgi:hypothetical protein